LVSNHSVSITSKFILTHTGKVYQEKYKPSKLFEALKELIDEGVIDRKEVDVLFYGAFQDWLRKEIEHYNLSDIVHQCGVLSHLTSLQKRRESQILLHLGWDDEKMKGMYTSKVFEYLSSQRPVLAVGGVSTEVVNNLLSETKAGVYCLTIEEVKDALYDFYNEYKQEGVVRYNGDLEKINKYSHREMARKYLEILDSLT
jgi:glycosyltransferase involved in cell wall biosynthesis